MAQFVELENWNLLKTSCITLIRPHAGIKYDSEKIKVAASIRVEWAEDVGELISVIGVAPWIDTGNEVEVYELLCIERKRLEKSIREWFPYIVRGLCMDMKIYSPPAWIREQLQQAATGTAERIAKEVHKMEEEENE